MDLTMSVIQIDYDLSKPGQNYDSLIEKIKYLGDGWCHAMDSVWLIATSKTIAEVYAALKSVIDANDRLLITQFRKPYAGWLDKSVHQWIDQHVPA